jgi:hypothetical protein
MPAQRRDLSVNQLAATRFYRDGGGFSPLPLGFCIEFYDPVPPGRIREALMAVIEQHEVLRYRLLPGTEHAELVSGRWLPELEALAPGPDGDLDAAAREAWAEAGVLAPGPFVKVAVCGDPVRVLCVLLDHLVADGWSLQVVAATLLAELGLADAPAARQRTSTFQRHVEDERDRLAGKDAADAFAPWREYLDGESPLPGRRFALLEVDDPQVAGSGGPLHRSVVLPAATVAAVNGAARQRRISPFMLASAVLARSMAQDLKVDRPAFVTAAANRISEGDLGVVGWYASTWPLLYDHARLGSAAECIALSRNLILGLHEMPVVPLPSLLKELAPHDYGTTTRKDYLSLQVDRSFGQFPSTAFKIELIPRDTAHSPEGGIYLSAELPEDDTAGMLEVLVDSSRFDLDRVCDWSAGWLAEAALLAARG